MNTRVRVGICMMVLLLTSCSGAAAHPSTPPPTEASLGDKVGIILGNLLILSLYSFPMSFAETWAFGDPRKLERQTKQESSGLPVTEEEPAGAAEKIGVEAAASADDWIAFSDRLTRWSRKLPDVKAGLAAGGCVMVVFVVAGAAAFALYYLFSGQPEQVIQIVPRFAYWFPFALLGMVTDVPFQIVYWEDRRLRVVLRLIIWWFPRLIIFAFVINPPLLQELDPATTALTVLAIDMVLAAFSVNSHVHGGGARAREPQLASSQSSSSRRSPFCAFHHRRQPRRVPCRRLGGDHKVFSRGCKTHLLSPLYTNFSIGDKMPAWPVGQAGK